MEVFASVGRRVVDAAATGNLPGAAAAAVAAVANGLGKREAIEEIIPTCTAIDLPRDGLLILNETLSLTLTENAIFRPSCLPDNTALAPDSTSSILNREPFLASTIPQVFVLGSMLFLAWVLVFILIITPRTYFIVGSPTGGILGTRTMMGGATGASSVIGVGGRPWLQKAATLGVGVSLLIATVNSFNVASRQYAEGIEDARELVKDVVGSLELRIIRTISFTFLWLAQVQTLIRLFPRHKEKVVIKWIGFGLIFLDTLFAILNVFVYDNAILYARDGFDNPVSALAYIFQLALNFVYLCAVLAYSWAKRRFAYYHNKMRNISVVAFISICSITVPLVFFVLDVTFPVFIGWGDYVRWVGAAAASVVVWEWVERIEALEREERKDGILGREIFDGDEVPYSSSTVDTRRWPISRKLGPRKSSSHDSSASHNSSDEKPGGNIAPKRRMVFNTLSLPRPTFVAKFADKLRNIHTDHDRIYDPKVPVQISTSTQSPKESNIKPHDTENTRLHNAPEQIQPPQNVASPVSRADTTSAASTVYAVVHHPGGDSNTPPIPLPSSLHTTPNPSPHPQQTQHIHPETSAYDFHPVLPDRTSMVNPLNHQQPIAGPIITQHKQITPPDMAATGVVMADTRGISYNPFSRGNIPNPFKRQRTAPPPEVTAAMEQDASGASSQPVLKRKRDRFKFVGQNKFIEPEDLPTFEIPAREGGAAWSPQEDHKSFTSKGNSDDSGSNPAASGSVSRGNTSGSEETKVELNQMPSIDGTLNAGRSSSENRNVGLSSPQSSDNGARRDVDGRR